MSNIFHLLFLIISVPSESLGRKVNLSGSNPERKNLHVHLCSLYSILYGPKHYVFIVSLLIGTVPWILNEQ
jgi:hypothetical protein